MASANNRSLVAIFFTVFIDLLGIGLIVPILAPLFLEADGLFPESLSRERRTELLSYLIAVFPLASFFSSPLLGGLSDKYGRRPVLFASLFVTVAAYVMLYTGVHMKSFAILLLGRLLTGIAAGNLAVVYSSIADLSSAEAKTRNFGLVGVAFGMGFIFGPALGAVLSNPAILPFFSYDTPFLGAALLGVVNVLLVYAFFPETLAARNADAKINLASGFQNLRKAFSNESLIQVFVVFFFFIFGFTMFTQFFQVYLIERLDYGTQDIGYLFTFIGVMGALTQGLIVRALSRRFKPAELLPFTLSLLSAGYLSTLLPVTKWQVYLTVPLIAMSQGITMPNFSSTVSNMAPPHLQGETLGMQQSVQSVAQLAALLIGGYVTGRYIQSPMLIAAGASITAFVLLLAARLRMGRKA